MWTAGLLYWATYCPVQWVKNITLHGDSGTYVLCERTGGAADYDGIVG